MLDTVLMAFLKGDNDVSHLKRHELDKYGSLIKLLKFKSDLDPHPGMLKRTFELWVSKTNGAACYTLRAPDVLEISFH